MKPSGALSLYVHIPFCTLKCSYCDFNSYAGLEELVQPYVDALIAEMELWSQYARGRPVPTVFFGGGTPSLLPIPQVERIVSALRDRFALEPEAELTLEANPGTVDPDYLRALVAMGVNRLSFGVQSFHDDELAALDRIHSAAEVEEAYRWARDAGFQRINLDLIYGLPEQPMERWQASLERAISLAPDHMSLYALTVEEGTKLAYDIDHGRAPEPDGDVQASMYEWSQERMAETGYQQYEISNWARPGQECRHNLVYWRNGDWLGLGAGAHSHLGGSRFADVYSPKRYVQLVQEAADAGPPDGTDVAALLKSMRQVTYVEEPRPELARADTLIMGLRLNEGVSLAEFRRRFGAGAEADYAETFAELTELGLLERTPSTSSGQAPERIRITDRGRLLANEVFTRLLPD
ncbi:MAG: radical SAM family heme chaperone HemW [Chloroflexi bacterium]|nr:radical SAM family heme chaperone HemW [Chloroflexota bacterium]